MKGELKALVNAGKVTPAVLGQSLGMAGLNIGKVVADINAATKSYAGMKVPITISYDITSKEFEVLVRTPSTSQLLLKEAGVTKGAGNREAATGNITFDKLMTVVKKKQEVLGSDLKKSVIQALGTCISMVLNIDGKPAKQVQEEVIKGDYDSKIK